MNPKRELIGGKICGVSIEDIFDPLMRDIRRLDKLCDELAKGRPLEKNHAQLSKTTQTGEIVPLYFYAGCVKITL